MLQLVELTAITNNIKLLVVTVRGSFFTRRWQEHVETIA